MAPSEGWGGDPAERGESIGVSRCARSDGICPTRRHPGDEAARARTPAARTAGEGEGGSRRRVVPGEMRGQEAAPTCGCHIERYRYHDKPVPRRVAEGTSAAGADEAVRTCGHYTDTAPRRPTPSTVLAGFKGGRLKNKCCEMRVEVLPSDGFQESVARCGFRHPSLVRRCPMPPELDTTRCAHMVAASSCVPVPTGARGGGGGRGNRDTHDDYAGTSRPQLHAPTADLPAQMYDTGSIVGPSDSKALSVGDEVKCKEVPGDLINQKGSIALPEKLRFDLSHGKPVQPQDLRKIESIVKQRIEAELELSAQEIKLADAKRINGLRAVFGEIYPDPVRVVSIGRKVEDVLPNLESKEWLSISTELCGGTSISNTRVAAEEDIAKGVRRITAATAECAAQAMKLASSIETDINEASKLDRATLEKKIGSINNTLDAAAIPAERKAELKGNVSKLEDQQREAKKKMGKENIQKAVNTAIDAAEAAVSEGKLFCVTHADVGLDTTAVREAVVKAMDRFKDPETRKPGVNIRSDKEIGRDADKKRLGTIGEDVKQLAERARDNREANNSSSTSASTKRSANNTVQILVKFLGSTIPVQENLNMLSANMLIEHVCRCVGVRPTDMYSTFCGGILEPNQILSYYQLQKDSMVYINPRLRGGSAGRKNWDAVIINLVRYHSVGLPWDLLLPSQTKIYPAVKVWYLDHPLQVRCRKVLIYLGRKHYVGICFGGFTSKQILFDADGNVHIDAAPQEYSQEFALLDYSAVSGIFDDALGTGNNKYPTYFYHLINFLSDNGPAVDCRSKAVIAFVTNHVSLLTHSQRIQISGFLDLLLARLSKDDSEALIAILENFYWGSRMKKVPAMNYTYFFHWWYDADRNICTPYKDNGVSLLSFSNNFFKHQTGFPLEQRDAAFALVTKDKNYLPQLLCSTLTAFKDPNKPCPPSVQAFIDEVIEMLGDHTVDCEIVQAN